MFGPFRSSTNCEKLSDMRYLLVERPIAAFAAHPTSGNPVLIQGRFGQKGNFELLTPLVGGGMAAYFRDNDVAPHFPWLAPVVFGTGPVDAVTMIQSNFGNPGNLEVIARQGDRLVFAFRDGLEWKGPFPLVSDGVEVTGVAGNPVLIQSRFGEKGNFELLTPLLQGGMASYFRDNDNSAFPWHKLTTFGAGPFEAVSMIQSNFGDPGNLEVVARVGQRLVFAFRDGLDWKGPFVM
jgi:hypothetical protein